jgi:hypothetical protein
MVTRKKKLAEWHFCRMLPQISPILTEVNKTAGAARRVVNS